jgi:hypothetical protein
MAEDRLISRCTSLQLDVLGDPHKPVLDRINIIVQADAIKKRIYQQWNRNERAIRMLCEELNTDKS